MTDADIEALVWDADLAKARESERVAKAERALEKRGALKLLRVKAKERSRESGAAWQARLARYAEGLYGDDHEADGAPPVAPEILDALFPEGDA